MKLYPPPFHLCPIYDYVNKWDFFYPPPSQIGQCLILGNFFFWKASLTKLQKFPLLSAQVESVLCKNSVLVIARLFFTVPQTLVLKTLSKVSLLNVMLLDYNVEDSEYLHCHLIVTSF